MGVPAFDPVDRNRGEDSTSCGSHFVEAEFILAFYSYGQRDDALIELLLSIPCGSGPLKANCQSARCRLSESAYRVEPLCCGMRIGNRSHQIRMVGGAAAQAESVVAGVNAQGIPSVHERDAGNRPSSQQVVGRSLGMLPEHHMQLLDSDHRVGCTGQVGMERLKNTPLRMENTGSASGESCFGRCLFRKVGRIPITTCGPWRNYGLTASIEMKAFGQTSNNATLRHYFPTGSNRRGAKSFKSRRHVCHS
jgi:hypothetical protein